MIIYPDKPWYDGQEFVHTTTDGVNLLGTYKEDVNTWSFSYYELRTDSVFTDTVYTVNMKPSREAINAARATFDDRQDLPNPNQFTTQQDVNWFLWDTLQNFDGGSSIWEDVVDPPTGDLGQPLFLFWWKPDEKLMYYWDTDSLSWELTGLMEFDRPPIMSDKAPTEHPKFPGEPLQEGDLWVDETDPTKYSLFAWDMPGQNWVPVGDSGRPPIFSDQEPTKHPDFVAPNDELVIGDIWYDNTDPNNLVQYIYDGNKWVVLGNDNRIMIGDSPPSGAVDGELFWNSSEDEMTLYIRYQGEWVAATSLEELETRVTAGELIQRQLGNRVTSGETIQQQLSGRVDALEQGGSGLDEANLVYKNKTQTFSKKQTLSDSALIKVKESNPLVIDSGNTYGKAVSIKKFVSSGQREETIHFDANGKIETRGSILADGQIKSLGEIIAGTNVVIPNLPIDGAHATPKIYTDAQDTIVHGMIDVIIGRRVYGKFQLQADDRSIRDGKFKLTTDTNQNNTASQATDWEDVNYMYFAYKDYDGNDRNLTDIKVGMQISLESDNGAATFIVNQLKVGGLNNFFGVTIVNFVGDPTTDDVYQMVCGDEGRLTAEEVGEIVLNRFSKQDAVYNSYGKVFRNDTGYIQFPNQYIGDGKMSWNGNWSNDFYISPTDANQFQWSFNTNSTITLPTPQMFSIYGTEQSGSKIGSLQLRGYFSEYTSNNNHVKLGGLVQVLGSSIYNNKTYIVNLGGFM